MGFGKFSNDTEFLSLGLDWLDVRVALPFADALREFRSAIDRCGEFADDTTGELYAPVVEDWEPMRRLGYQSGAQVKSPPTSGALKLMGDHPTSRGWSLLSGSQQAADWVREFVEALHVIGDAPLQAPQVNRVDVALDFTFPIKRHQELFRFAQAVVGERHHFEGTKGHGETIYMNWSKRPEYRASRTVSLPIYSARLYQKGLQQGALLDIEGAPDPDWWRFELMVRPVTPETKQQCFVRSENELLAAPRWCRDFLGGIGYDPGDRAAKLTGRKKVVKLEDENARKATAMRSLGHMADQYAKAAQELAELVGRDRVLEVIEQALFTKRGEVDAQDVQLRPGDLLRREADKLWVDRFDARFRCPGEPGSSRTH